MSLGDFSPHQPAKAMSPISHAHDQLATAITGPYLTTLPEETTHVSVGENFLEDSFMTSAQDDSADAPLCSADLHTHSADAPPYSTDLQTHSADTRLVSAHQATEHREATGEMLEDRTSHATSLSRESSTKRDRLETEVAGTTTETDSDPAHVEYNISNMRRGGVEMISDGEGHEGAHGHGMTRGMSSSQQRVHGAVGAGDSSVNRMTDEEVSASSERRLSLSRTGTDNASLEMHVLGTGGDHFVQREGRHVVEDSEIDMYRTHGGANAHETLPALGAVAAVGETVNQEQAGKSTAQAFDEDEKNKDFAHVIYEERQFAQPPEWMP
jgi:hypothetical protein